MVIGLQKGDGYVFLENVKAEHLEEELSAFSGHPSIIIGNWSNDEYMVDHRVFPMKEKLVGEGIVIKWFIVESIQHIENVRKE